MRTLLVALSLIILACAPVASAEFPCAPEELQADPAACTPPAPPTPDPEAVVTDAFDQAQAALALAEQTALMVVTTAMDRADWTLATAGAVAGVATGVAGTLAEDAGGLAEAAVEKAQDPRSVDALAESLARGACARSQSRDGTLSQAWWAREAHRQARGAASSEPLAVLLVDGVWWEANHPSETCRDGAAALVVLP